MRRFNIFQHSHSALRSLLLDTSLLIQFTDFSKPEQVQATFDQVTELVLACQRQAEEEARYIIPAISHLHGRVEECFAHDSEQKPSASMKMLNRMNLYEQYAGTPRAARLAASIANTSFQRFAEQVIAGMQLQEELLNPLLWSYYSDDALRQLLMQIEGRQTITEWLSLCTWMMKDMSDEEIVSWLLNVRPTLPLQVFELLLERISGKMPMMRWDNVQTGMTEEAMVA